MVPLDGRGIKVSSVEYRGLNLVLLKEEFNVSNVEGLINSLINLKLNGGLHLGYWDTF